MRRHEYNSLATAQRPMRLHSPMPESNLFCIDFHLHDNRFLAKMHMNSHKNSSIRMRMDDAQVANGLLRLNSRYHQVCIVTKNLGLQ
jgi:propanediol dehydratase large subunit